MALLELAMVTGALVELGVEGTLDAMTRREGVLRVLKRCGIAPDNPPTDFQGVYTWALVEFGVGQPEPVLAFFRHTEVQAAFRRSFERDSPEVLLNEAAEFLDWNKIGDDLRALTIDPRMSFARFTAVFLSIVDAVRTPVEVRQDLALARIQEQLGEMLARLEALALDDIRTELESIKHSTEVRHFSAPRASGPLRVFISSRISELQDVRDIVKDALQTRGIDAHVIETASSASPESGSEHRLRALSAADVFVGLFWRGLGDGTEQEYRMARQAGKPCFVYIRGGNHERTPALEVLLKEVRDPQLGVSWQKFERASELAAQVADDLHTWLVRRHRELTATMDESRVSKDEIERLQGEVARLRQMTARELPAGTPADRVAAQLRPWFRSLGYTIERHNERGEDRVGLIVQIPARRGYDRVLVWCVGGEAGVSAMEGLSEAVKANRTDEGWAVALRRVSPAARQYLEERGGRELFCYTLDELIDESADFDRYLDWLDNEVRRLGIDQRYIPLAATKDEVQADSGAVVGRARYDANNGWVEGYLDRWLDDPSQEHVSILGEFGTGKTWLALRYTWLAAQRYREAKKAGIQRPRLPLYIPLRDYAKAVSVESLFSEFFFRRHEIPIPGYSAFEHLNRSGRFLLIFDGFDEMAARIDTQKMVDNFWELARVVVPGAKVILTCRTEHFPEAKRGRRLLSAEMKASTAYLTGEPPQFEVLELEPLAPAQVRKLLAFYADAGTVARVMNDRRLVDLARRPVMTNFILDALPDIELGRPVDISRIYLYATCRKMERDIAAKRTFTSLPDKLFFLCELAHEMLSSDRMRLNYRQFPAHLRRYFGPAVEEQTELDHWYFDMTGQTMLTRNADGDYAPAHRSLLEFFAAWRYVAELGVLAPDFTEPAREPLAPDGAERRPVGQRWSDWFSRKRIEAGGTRSPLLAFTPESLDVLVVGVGRAPLSKAVLDLAIAMVDETTGPTGLMKAIRVTKGAHAASGFVGGNAATLLLRLDPTALKGRRLGDVNLDGVDFGAADLRKVRLRGASINSAIFRATDLRGADLRDSSLEGAQIREGGEVQDVTVSPDGAFVATGEYGRSVTVRDRWTGNVVSSLRVESANSTFPCWSDDGEQLAVGYENPGSVVLWNWRSEDAEEVWDQLEVSWVTGLAFGRDGKSILAAGMASTGPVVEEESGFTAILRPHGEVELTRFDDSGVRPLYFSKSVDGETVFASRWFHPSPDEPTPAPLWLQFSIDDGSLLAAGPAHPVSTWAISVERSRGNDLIIGDARGGIHVSNTADGMVRSIEMPRLPSDAEGANGRVRGVVQYGEVVFTALDANGLCCVDAWALGKDSNLLHLVRLELPVRGGRWGGSIDVTPDGRHLFAAEGSAHLHRIDARPFVERSEDSASRESAKWHDESSLRTPEGKRPNPAFLTIEVTHENTIRCQGLRVAGASGLDTPVASIEGAVGENQSVPLGEWLGRRGAST